MCLFALCTAKIVHTKEALADEIIALPDAPYFSQQFSGYVQVFNTTQLFYWFVTAKNNPETAPLLYWTSGGPGCSGLLASLSEQGPYQPISDGKGGVKLALRDVTWNENYNMVYVEQPDVGFTNVEPGTGPRVWTDGEIARRNADFLEGFFVKFPAFKKNDFAISSESYGGHYIPTLAKELISRINSGRSTINFKWSIVGNPLIYLPTNTWGQYMTLIGRGIIPHYPLGAEYSAKCTPDLTAFPNPPASRPAICDDLEAKMDAMSVYIDPYAMSFPICTQNGKIVPGGHEYGEYIINQMSKAQSKYRNRTVRDTLNLHQQIYDLHMEAENNKNAKADLMTLINQLTGTTSELTAPEDDYFPKRYQACEENLLATYLNRKDVQAAMHANLKRSRWSMCNNINYSDFDFIDSMLPVYLDNAEKAPWLKQLVFSGTDDTMCATIEATAAFFNNYKVDQKVNWEVLSHKGQQIGAKTNFVVPSTLTFVTINGAGHMCPSTRPEHTRQVIERYIQGKL
jgi:carboxypeptidase C (cathepsin A)